MKPKSWFELALYLINSRQKRFNQIFGLLSKSEIYLGRGDIAGISSSTSLKAPRRLFENKMFR